MISNRLLVSSALGWIAALFAWDFLKKRFSQNSSSVVHGEWTPARQQAYQVLMGHENNPSKLRKASQLFGQEGLTDAASLLANKAIQVAEQERGAAELVERSRAGDQHAVAMMREIAIKARRGNLRSRVSCELIAEYARKHPPPPLPPKVRISA